MPDFFKVSRGAFIIKNKAADIFLSIKQQGVLIKNMSAQGGLLSDCLRVTIGKPDENQAFLEALRTSLADLVI